MAELTRRNYALAQDSLAAFVRQAWSIVEPDTPLLWNWHLDMLCEYLEAVTFGEKPCEEWRAEYGERDEITQLIINEPPGHMKSLIVSVMWPCWEWTYRPETRTIFSSYSEKLSIRHSLNRRLVIESEWYECGMHDHWGRGGFALRRDQNMKTQFDNESRGQMQTTSTGGTIQGSHGDKIIIDDPLNPQEAASEADRTAANDFFDLTLSQRVRDKKRPIYVIVMQRLHQSDLTGHVLAKRNSKWVQVCLPAIAEAHERHVFPRSGRVVERAVGEILWPEREGLENIEQAKEFLGSYGFAGQYQQRPTPAEGGLVKREWIRYWVTKLTSDDDPAKVVQLPGGLTRHRQSWDMGLWGAARDDYTVGLVGAQLGANMFVLDGDRRRLDLPGCIAALKGLSARNPLAVRKVIENTANGAEIARTMRDEIPGIIPNPVKGDKEARLVAAQPRFEAGNVFLPHPREQGWVADCVEELIGFPFGDHDDFVDALSQLVSDFDNLVVLPSAGSGGPKRTTHIEHPRAVTGAKWAGGS